MAKQLSKHLTACDLYVSVQSAYRPNHSTETALLKVVNDLLLAVDSGDATVLSLLDKSAAFDTIDHVILLNRLRYGFGLSGSVFSWFESYLSARRQSVSSSGINSVAVLLLSVCRKDRFLVPFFLLCTTVQSTLLLKSTLSVTISMLMMNRFTLPFLFNPTIPVNAWPSPGYLIVWKRQRGGWLTTRSSLTTRRLMCWSYARRPAGAS